MPSPRRTLSVLFATAALAACPTAAHAQTYSYQWADTSGNAINTTLPLTVGAGTTFTLRVYITETGGTKLTTDGLFSAGVRAQYYNSAVLGSTSGVLTVTNVIQNTAFGYADGFVSTINNPNYSQFDESTVSVTNGVKGTALDNRVLLGSFTFTATSAIGQSTVLSAIDIPAPSDDTYTASPSFTQLDGVLNPANLTVATVPVPEPAGVLVVGGLLLAAARRLARRTA